VLTRLWDHLKKGQKQRLYGWFQQWADIEAQATVLRWYEPLVVPGLLQTEDYARAILSARPDGNLGDLGEQVAARLARQAVLGRTGAPQLWCILDEGVPHRAIGGSKVMRSQLYRPAEVAEHPKTTRTGAREADLRRLLLRSAGRQRGAQTGCRHVGDLAVPGVLAPSLVRVCGGHYAARGVCAPGAGDGERNPGMMPVPGSGSPRMRSMMRWPA